VADDKVTTHLAYPNAIARPPVTPLLIAPSGAYLAVRSSPADGSCGVHPYPCHHPGVDLQAPLGTAVSAPHSGWVLVSQATNDPPFEGYGPAVVLLAHDDGRANPGRGGSGEIYSLRYSLLAHLDPNSLRFNAPWKRAEGLTETNDPKRYQILEGGTAARVAKWPTWAQHVEAGEFLGNIGEAGHVHWEVRINPMRSLGGAQDLVDPLAWLHDYDPSLPWDTTSASPITPGRGKKGGLGDLLVWGGIAYALSELL